MTAQHAFACSKLTIKTRRFEVFIINFEHILHLFHKLLNLEQK